MTCYTITGASLPILASRRTTFAFVLCCGSLTAPRRYTRVFRALASRLGSRESTCKALQWWSSHSAVLIRRRRPSSLVTHALNNHDATRAVSSTTSSTTQTTTTPAPGTSPDPWRSITVDFQIPSTLCLRDPLFSTSATRTHAQTHALRPPSAATERFPSARRNGYSGPFLLTGVITAPYENGYSRPLPHLGLSQRLMEWAQLAPGNYSVSGISCLLICA